MDRTGRFTLPELPHRLGVSVSSIYHHCPGRADIVEGIRGLVVGDPALAGAASWAEAVTRWARAYRDAFGAHPARALSGSDADRRERSFELQLALIVEGLARRLPIGVDPGLPQGHP